MDILSRVKWNSRFQVIEPNVVSKRNLMDEFPVLVVSHTALINTFLFER